MKLLNKPLRILLYTNSLIQLAGGMLAPIYALFVEEIGGDLLEASLTGAVFACAAGITTLFMGKVADKAKEEELIVAFGYLVMGVGFFLYTQVNSLFALLIVQVIVGFAESFYSPAFDGLYTKHIPKTKRSRAWGVWESMNYFSMAGGALIGGLLVKYFGFNCLFIIMSLLSITSALYIYTRPRKLL